MCGSWAVAEEAMTVDIHEFHFSGSERLSRWRRGKEG